MKYKQIQLLLKASLVKDIYKQKSDWYLIIELKMLGEKYTEI